MKVKEKFQDNNDGTFTVGTSYSNEPYLERTEAARSMGLGKTKDTWCVGSVPMHLLEQWMKEEGVSWEDSEGRKRVIIKKLNDPNFKKLRIVEGKI